jgi:hypothetical protein
MYILISDGADAVYPYSPSRLRADNPQTSFPDKMPASLLMEWGVYPVTPTFAPVYDPATHRLKEAPPQQINAEWVQAWIVEPLTPEEIEANLLAWRQDMVVSPLQMRRALRAQGLADAVAAYVAQQDADTQDAWEYAIQIRRDDALIVAAASALGKTPTEIDDLFRGAAAL